MSRSIAKRAENLRYRYGITLQQYQDAYVAQDGACAICHTPHDTLAVDHDHDTGKLRGLLCGPCNRGIGMFKDSRVLIRNAADYIDSHVHWPDWNAHV